MRLSDFQALTFDCYGTLIDWEAGILQSLSPLLDRAEDRPDPQAVLQEFARSESSWEARAPTMRYPEILGHVCAELCGRFGVAATDAECRGFGSSVGDWPAFEDSTSALSYLRGHFRLVVVSNVDRRSFSQSARRLGVELDAVYTAEEIGSYKPDLRNFEHMIAAVRADLGIPREGILHTAQSLFHDHVPAARLGLATCWIDRRAACPGGGATPPPGAPVSVDFRFGSLAEMAAAHAEE